MNMGEVKFVTSKYYTSEGKEEYRIKKGKTRKGS